MLHNGNRTIRRSPAGGSWEVPPRRKLHAFRDRSVPWHPSLTGLIDPLIQPHPVRGAAFLVWLLAGWALVKR